MPSKQTANYKLSQWVKTDKVLMEDFNADNAAIDAAIKKVEDAKADKSTVTALQTAVSGKGNCRICVKNYTGNGTHGSKTPNSVTFPGKPEVVFVGGLTDGTFLIAFYGQTVGYIQNNDAAYITLSWSDNTLTWYSLGDERSQLNKQGVQYSAVALIAES